MQFTSGFAKYAWTHYSGLVLDKMPTPRLQFYNAVANISVLMPGTLYTSLYMAKTPHAKNQQHTT